MRLESVLALALLAGPAGAETVVVPAGCAKLTVVVETVVGVDLTVAPAASQDGWCVLDGARSTGDAAVRVSADTLRLRGEVVEDRLVALEVEGAGLRVAPALNNRDMPDWLRDLVRLQSAELHLALRRDEAGDLLRVERGHLGLSGGAELIVTGDLAGAELASASVLTGRVSSLHLEWLNDGRSLRPLLEVWGQGLEPGATGTKAVMAARAALQGAVSAVAATTLGDADAEAVAAVIQALPQGRGRVIVDVASDSGIGAAQLGVLAMADDPMSPEALARFMQGTRVSVSWTPGLAP